MNIHHENQEVIIRADGSILIQTINTEPSMTHQQFLEQSDINNIMKNYSYNQFPHSQSGQYIDHTILPKDLIQAHQMIEDAQTAFNSLPALVRERFQNDPTQLLSFIQNDQNKEEAIKLGLVPPPPQPNPYTQIQNDLNEIKTHTKPKKQTTTDS